MLNLSEKHEMIRMIAEKLAKEKVAPRAKEIDQTGAFPWDLVDIFKKHGFLYLMLPEKFGGLDGDITSLCVVIEELAKVSGAASLIPLAHNVGLMPVMVAANDEQKEYIYSKVAEPDKLNIVAFALTESEAGSDASHMRTQYTREGNTTTSTARSRCTRCLPPEIRHSGSRGLRPSTSSVTTPA
jgi:alkylation response protein AidB-like acyl-CoA dehydrogenase